MSNEINVDNPPGVSDSILSTSQIDIPMRTHTDDNNSLTSRNSTLLHFSDGTVLIEEQENGITVTDQQKQTMATPTTSNQVGIRHKRWKLLQTMQSNTVDNVVNFSKGTLKGTLKALDYVGGGVASFLGITDPKFATEISYGNEQEKSDRDREQKLRSEMQGWKTSQSEIIENQV